MTFPVIAPVRLALEVTLLLTAATAAYAETPQERFTREANEAVAKREAADATLNSWSIGQANLICDLIKRDNDLNCDVKPEKRTIRVAIRSTYINENISNSYCHKLRTALGSQWL